MEKILIIEDQQDIREILHEILDMSGYAVTEAVNGKEGYDAILVNKPDLVICDIAMPKMDGFELLATITQKLKDDAVPPFIFLTAKVEKEDIRRGMNLGADDYIVKPFDHNELLDIVKLRLDKRKNILGNVESQSSSNEISESFDKIALPTSEGLDLVKYSDVMKCEADRSYCVFHLTTGAKVLVSRPMKDFETTLLAKGFLKIHKSVIINVNHVNQYIKGKGGLVRMSDGSVVSVSVRKKEELMKIIKTL
jgi:DNA-binding LytR/AlgR family response regulator